MEPDRPSAPARDPLDDAALAAAVREVAEDWRMPPQRLDEVTWRDRVGRGRRAGGSGGGRGVAWTRRLVGAAAVAVIATVSLSYLAVWLTGPSRDHAATNPATPTGAPGSGSPAPSASAPAPSLSANGELPQLAVNGAMPAPAKVMVRTNGRFAVADLTTGVLGEKVIDPTQGPSTVLARPGGGWVCVCGDWSELSTVPHGLRLTLDVVDASGASVERRPLTQYSGAYDPGFPKAEQPQLVDARIVGTTDGRFALIGWTARDGAAGWRVGVDVLDLTTLTLTSSAVTQTGTDATVGGKTPTRNAPAVSLSPSGTTMLVTSTWYIEDPTDATPPSGTDHWVTPFADGRLGADGSGGDGAFTPAGSRDAAGCLEFERGLIAEDTYYSLCWKEASGRSQVSRVRLDGSVVDSQELPQDEGESASFVTQTGDALFVWNPFGASIVRYDFTSGTVTEARATPPTSSAPGDTLASLGRRVGRWIAPSALAKMNLEPGVVASVDGTRIYALGIGGPDGGAGSTGVFAFDARTLDVVGTWAPIADLASLAVSLDGRFVYAAGQGGVSATGQPTPGRGASITVYDTTDGSVRLVAGQLGSGDLWLTEPILR